MLRRTRALRIEFLGGLLEKDTTRFINGYKGYRNGSGMGICCQSKSRQLKTCAEFKPDEMERFVATVLLRPDTEEFVLSRCRANLVAPAMSQHFGGFGYRGCLVRLVFRAALNTKKRLLVIWGCCDL